MKKWILIGLILAVAACCLFPPWKGTYSYRETYSIQSPRIKTTKNIGYGFIFAPPSLGDRVGTVDVDFGRLGIQLGLLIFLGSCVVFSEYISPKAKK